MDTLFTFHSHMRHLLFLLGALAIIAPLVAVVRKQDLAQWAKIIVKVYTYALTLQFLIGIVQLVVRWDSFGEGLRHRLEHGFIMLLAVGVTHMSGKFMRVPSTKGPRNVLFMMVASLVLILLGIIILPTGKMLLGMG